MELRHFHGAVMLNKTPLSAWFIENTDWQRTVQTGLAEFTAGVIVLAVLRG